MLLTKLLAIRTEKFTKLYHYTSTCCPNPYRKSKVGTALLTVLFTTLWQPCYNLVNDLFLILYQPGHNVVTRLLLGYEKSKIKLFTIYGMANFRRQ